MRLNLWKSYVGELAESPEAASEYLQQSRQRTMIERLGDLSGAPPATEPGPPPPPPPLLVPPRPPPAPSLSRSPPESTEAPFDRLRAPPDGHSPRCAGY